MKYTASLFAVVVLAAGVPAIAAEDGTDEVMQYLKKIHGDQRVRVTPVKDSVDKAFPKFRFVAVLFPQFPIGREAPAPLKEANVLVVSADGKVTPLSDPKSLEKFFLEHAPKSALASDNAAVTLAWLRLSAELSQDGFYKFKAPEITKATASDVSGKLAVDPIGGNKGEITATLHFKDGAIIKIDHKVNLSPGPRPICQATKLLDPDPIVRKMAEDAIRVMGSNAKDYLEEQRKKANPDLQKAIDRIWQRIQQEGR